MEKKFEFHPFDKVLVRDADDNLWKCDLFSHLVEHSLSKYVCVGSWYKQCIPYKGNKHLLGTTDPYVEPYEPKDGAFVVIKIFNAANWFSIFNEIDKALEEVITYAAFADENDDYCLGGDSFCSLDSVESIRPATEEEKQLILSKLHEIGKDWCDERKEIVDWEWEPSEDEMYYFPSFNSSECKFFTFDAPWYHDNVDRRRKEMNFVFKTEEECQAMCGRLNEAIKNVK